MGMSPRHVLRVAVLFLLAVCTTRAQVSELRPLDVAAGLRDGWIHLAVAPHAGNDSLRPFDGNPNSDLLVLSSDSLVLTLRFDTPVQLQVSKVFFMSNGTWTLEGAATPGDLDARTGSYRMLAGPRVFGYRVWDSVAFDAAPVGALRLRARDTVFSYFDLGEWTLLRAVTFTKLVVLPSPAKLIPGGTLRMKVSMQDEQGAIVPYTLRYPIDWSVRDAAVATIDANGVLTGAGLGTTEVVATTEPVILRGAAPVNVVPDFVSERVPSMHARVALVLIDPLLADYGYEPLHVKFGWRDPRRMANALVRYFRESTDSVVVFAIDTLIELNRTFTRLRNSYLTVEQYEQYLSQPGWTALKALADSGLLSFDYRGLVTTLGLDSLRNAGRIDEVWVYAGPYMAMYESQLLGPTAFWWNSPPIRDGTGLKKLLSVMGLNYERGVDLALHSFGHRFESAMVQAYWEAQGRRWNDTSANPTAWDLFTRIEKDVPGGAHVGNIHFPPNGRRDYDYGNTAMVTSYAQNWFRYPYLYSQSTQVHVSTWIYPSPEPLAEGLDHLGYLWWWYNHAPRYRGITDGVLNNWWHYFLDYDSAVALAGRTAPLGVNEGAGSGEPGTFRLEQNYPNPFNPQTTIAFTLPRQGRVSLTVFDILGRRLATLVDGLLAPGFHLVRWDARALASGVYLYRLDSPWFVQTRKMMLLH